MNTLKPLLIVAVLAGVGYGVYVRLNRGANAPPPPVTAGWDAGPSVELPGEPNSAPWGPSVPGTGGGAPGGHAPPNAIAPPSQPLGAPGGPPLAGGPAPGDAPPYGATNAGGEAPPYASAGGPAQPGDASMPPQTAAPQDALAGGSPFNAAPPETAAAGPKVGPGGPAVDPYAEPGPPAGGDQNQATASPYPSTPDQGAAASSPAGVEVAVPGGAPAAGGAGGAGGEFGAALASAKHELEGGQMASALRQLSTWHGNPRLTPQEQQELGQMLDQVAGTVVYSTQHLLEPPYEVQPGERLEEIGTKYSVPWELLAKINGIDDPATLRPGERLKVVRGPFQAIVSIEHRELTLLTSDGSYAGRFKIGLGGEHPPQEGTFQVAEKVTNPVYYGRERAIGADDPNNPLGERWIGLGNHVGIHGTNNPQNIGRTDLPGSISLSQHDVEDVYDILSVGSRVTIRR